MEIFTDLLVAALKVLTGLVAADGGRLERIMFVADLLEAALSTPKTTGTDTAGALSAGR